MQDSLSHTNKFRLTPKHSKPWDDSGEYSQTRSVFRKDQAVNCVESGQARTGTLLLQHFGRASTATLLTLHYGYLFVHISISSDNM